METERKRDEDRVAEMSQNLARYKREVENCQTAARNLREEEARYDREAGDKLEKAEKLEAEARQLDQEATR